MEVNETNETLENYRKSVSILAFSGSNLIFENSNLAHANIVITNIFKQVNDYVLIYDNDLSGDIAKNGEQLITELTECVRNKQVQIKICLKQRVDSNPFQDLITDLALRFPERIKVRLADRKIRDCITQEFGSDLNFAVGDNKMFRLEYSENNDRKAFCSFNNQHYPEKLTTAFHACFDSLAPY